VSEAEKKSEEQPAKAEKESLMKSLNTPQSVLVGFIMMMFGGGGMFSFEKLSSQIDEQTKQLANMTMVITRIEAREASFQESISVAKALAERHEERLRIMENSGVQREARLQALEKLVEEMRRGTPR
jgi:hypothetical protein